MRTSGRLGDLGAVIPSAAGGSWQRGLVADDPTVGEAHERLAAGTYSMARPVTGELVAARVPHSVPDLGENARLRQLLPVTVHPREVDGHIGASGPQCGVVRTAGVEEGPVTSPQRQR